MKSAAFLLLLSAAAPVYAQDHPGHQMPPSDAPSGDRPQDSSADHGHMDHRDGGQTASPTASAPGDADAQSMSNMPGMEHPPAQPADAEIPEGPPPPEAFEGPLHAPVPGVDPTIMDASRARVVTEVSGMPVAWFQADRFEYRLHHGRDGYLWDVPGYYGGDIDKAWFKSEGEAAFGRKTERAEVQALWSHAIGPWLDLQAGVRQDLTRPARTYAVVGVQGLAPYRVDFDVAAFLSDEGDLTARAEAELDQRITQRLILQPRAEITFAAQDVPEQDIGAGVDRIEAGVRLRYEFTRQLAPYIGIEQEWRTGKSADYARARGEHARATNFVAGVRFWF